MADTAKDRERNCGAWWHERGIGTRRPSLTEDLCVVLLIAAALAVAILG